MNHLESLVPARETCERMKAAGFPQDTAFVWGPPQYKGPSPRSAFRGEETCAAPTLQEILGQFPCPLRRAVYNYSDGSLVRYVEGEITVTANARPCVRLNWGERGYTDRVECHENTAEAAAHLYLALSSASLLPTQPEEAGR